MELLFKIKRKYRSFYRFYSSVTFSVDKTKIIHISCKKMYLYYNITMDQIKNKKNMYNNNQFVVNFMCQKTYN